MKVVLIWVGKTSELYLQEGIQQYVSRLKHYVSFELKEIASLRNAASLSESQLKTKEGELILGQLQAGDFLVLLDEKGKEMTSRELSQFVERHQISGIKRVVFVIGGAFGFSADVYKAAQMQLALSRLTFSHQMVRLIFAEQLYRAMTIIKGEPYHHD